MKKRFLSIFLCMIVLFVNLSAVSFAQSPQTFADVPESYWAYPWIEALFQAGITEGCEKNPLKFCPDDLVTRAQMAIFLKRGKMGGDY
ncbi:MAG: S-layer homology domain-containing protein, partial [Anaerolineales bacterium]